MLAVPLDFVHQGIGGAEHSGKATLGVLEPGDPDADADRGKFLHRRIDGGGNLVAGFGGRIIANLRQQNSKLVASQAGHIIRRP